MNINFNEHVSEDMLKNFFINFLLVLNDSNCPKEKQLSRELTCRFFKVSVETKNSVYRNAVCNRGHKKKESLKGGRMYVSKCCKSKIIVELVGEDKKKLTKFFCSVCRLNLTKEYFEEVHEEVLPKKINPKRHKFIDCTKK